MTFYIPIPTEDRPRLAKDRRLQPTHFKVTVSYLKGGLNFWTGQRDERGYYLTVTPVERDEQGPFVAERQLLTPDTFSGGFKVLLRPTTRMHRATLQRIAQHVEHDLTLLAEALIKGDDSMLRHRVQELSRKAQG